MNKTIILPSDLVIDLRSILNETIVREREVIMDWENKNNRLNSSARDRINRIEALIAIVRKQTQDA
mgnify:CR=1 FL=1